MFTIIATIIFFLLACVWSRKRWVDLTIKIALWVMFLWGVFNVLNASGYIVKV